MKRLWAVVILMTLTGAGCGMPSRGLDGNVNVSVVAMEPEWIRNGEPIEMEQTSWYPTDEVERLMENEVVRIGQFRDVAVLVERVDVKPYARLYTRFEKGRYRAFEPRN